MRTRTLSAALAALIFGGLYCDLPRTMAATPVNPDASPEARALLNFIHAMYGKKTLSGQMWAPWGIDEIETYFLKMAEPVKSCTFTVDSSERAGNEFYFRWTMELVAKRAADRKITALGMSHVRFEPSGKVIFQQDYWDSSTLLDELPVVGWFTKMVKRRLE